jgi:O-antigen/teichoic acid export membrane protein
MILRNMFSMSGLNALKAIASIVVSTVVAGAVPPAQYGLVAFALPFVAFLTLITDLGLASAIIRHPDLDRRQAGSAVAFMLLSGLSGGIILASTSTLIERASGLQGLAPLLIGFSAVTAMSICATAPRALMERTLSYGRIALIEGAAMLFALAAFSWAVHAAAGIFSLVIYHIAVQSIRALAFSACAWPLFELNRHFRQIAGLVRFGVWVFATNMLSYAARNVGNLMVGTFLGASALGFYGLATQFMTMPLMLITWPVSGVLLSTLARMADKNRHKRELICAVITATTAITFPAMTFLAFGARFPIALVYGHRWDGLAEIITLLAPVGAIQSIASYNGAVLVANGAVRLNFGLSIVNGVGLSGVFLLAIWLGLHAMILTYCVSAICVSLLVIYFMCNVAEISLTQFLSCLIPGTVASVAGIILTKILKGLSPQSLSDWLEMTGIYATAVALAFLVTRNRIMAIIGALTVSARSVAEAEG